MENKRIEVNPNMFIITGSINNELNKLVKRERLSDSGEEKAVHLYFV